MAYTQIQKINNLSPAISDGWGTNLVVDGYHMVVGRTNGVLSDVLKRNINGVWEHYGSLGISEGFSMYGNYILATSPVIKFGWVYNKDSFISSLQNFIEASATTSFGISTDISENYIVFGDQAYNSNAGEIFIYEKTGVDTWTAYENNPVIADSPTAEDFFGSAVATNDGSIIVGAKGDSNKKGAVYIFQKDADTGVWEQTQKLFASDGEANDQFGESISVSGDYFVVGASLKDSLSGDINSGAAYVFKYSTGWYEVDKLVGVNESSYEGNHFGESVYINEDHIIVGSPEARNGQGVADIFYKKRSWGHLIKLIADDGSAGDNFGTSVSISGRTVLVGSPGYDSAVTGGAVYLFEDPSVRLRLAQEFEVGGNFIPTKASIYLKRAGENRGIFWPIYNTVKVVIDATNFSTISDPVVDPSIDFSGDISAHHVIFEDTIGGFTGNGYMIVKDFSEINNYSRIINYPIRAINPDTYDLWMRVINIDADSLEMEVLMDGVVTKTILTTIGNPSDGLEWVWVSTTLVIPDGETHTLGIRIKENNTAIDKIYIEKDSSTPYAEGPDYTQSQYLTTHLRVYDTDGNISENNSYGAEPNTALPIYDYKNSITEIIQDDWYNFNINILGSNERYDKASYFFGNYYLVMATTGSSPSNFISWELIDNDEESSPSSDVPTCPVSAIKF